MTTPQIHRASAAFLIGIYSIVFLGMAAAFIAIAYLLEIENAAMGLIIAAAAAMTMARNWVAREQAKPSQIRAWTISFGCALVTLAFFSIIAMAGIAGDEAALRDIQREDPILIVGVAGMLLAISLLVIRLGLWVGTLQAMKLIR